MKEKKFDTLMVLHILFAFLVLGISIYVIVTVNYQLFPLLFTLMGVMYLIIGLREYKRTKNLLWGIFFLCTALFMLFVAAQGIVIN
ncbi:DUF3953 domain-containing protein [Lysinibacillus sp. NPDC093210]|jgi:hypothetical protein|uniref:DUF3953 domain-containing protein n=1 Tax=Lysinibacillus sp. NPDC093210 TaxID=3364133 RepID=UPI0037F83065